MIDLKKPSGEEARCLPESNPAQWQVARRAVVMWLRLMTLLLSVAICTHKEAVLCVCVSSPSGCETNPEQSLILFLVCLSEQGAVGQKNKAMADQSMSVPVTNGGAMIVVTQVQPVTIPAPSVGNHGFSRAYPLSLGVS